MQRNAPDRGPRGLPVAGTTDDQSNMDRAANGIHYKEMVQTEGWKHYKEFLENRIELLDRKKDLLNEEAFNEYKAIKIEIRVLRRMISQVARTIVEGERATTILLSKEKSNA